MNNKRTIVVNDGIDFYVIEWYGNNLMEAQESFRKGEIKPIYKFDCNHILEEWNEEI